MEPNRVVVWEGRDAAPPIIHHRFRLTIPGLPDGRPHTVVEYHHYVTGHTEIQHEKHGKSREVWVRKLWWGTLTVCDYSPLKPRTAFWTLGTDNE